jgi:hypothetical protein
MFDSKNIFRWRESLEVAYLPDDTRWRARVRAPMNQKKFLTAGDEWIFLARSGGRWEAVVIDALDRDVSSFDR